MIEAENQIAFRQESMPHCSQCLPDLSLPERKSGQSPWPRSIELSLTRISSTGSPRSGVCAFPCGVSSRRSRSIPTGMISAASIRNLNPRIFAKRSNLPRGTWTRPRSLSNLCKRFPLDQGLPRSTAGLLSQGGWDVVHVSEIGMRRADDREILREGASLRASAPHSMGIFVPCSRPAASAGHLRYASGRKVWMQPCLALFWPRVEDALDSVRSSTGRR
jgi:hypothetical protein